MRQSSGRRASDSPNSTTGTGSPMRWSASIARGCVRALADRAAQRHIEVVTMLKLKTHFNTTPAEYDRARGGHLERRRAALARATLAHGGTRNVLEIGSGTGRLLAQLAAEQPDVAFLGID